MDRRRVARGEVRCGGGSDNNKMETFPSEEEGEGKNCRPELQAVFFMEQLHDIELNGMWDGRNSCDFVRKMEELARNRADSKVSQTGYSN